MTSNPYPYPRQSFCFDLDGVKCKSRAEILSMQRQWETFERIENYNDVIYNRFCKGLRDKTYYQFSNSAELNDYRVGQMLHTNRYPWLSTDPGISTISGIYVSTLASISGRKIPNVEVIAGPPNYSQVPKMIPTSTIMTSAEYMAQLSENAIYSHVSTYNDTHKYKYIFTSDEEKMAYYRAERRARLGVP